MRRLEAYKIVEEPRIVDWTPLKPLTAFTLGIVGSLVLGAGMCLSMGVLGSGTAAVVGGK